MAEVFPNQTFNEITFRCQTKVFLSDDQPQPGVFEMVPACEHDQRTASESALCLIENDLVFCGPAKSHPRPQGLAATHD